MNLVLGLSMTSSSVRWVLVEGTTGEGATLDRGSLPTDTGEAFDAVALISALFAKAGARQVHAVGLTWTGAAETTASAVWQALTDHGVENVIAVSDLEAAEALTRGIADIAGYDRVVVCVVEAGTTVIAAVTPDGVSADRVDTAALGDVAGQSPDAVFVVGSGDVDGVVASLEQSTPAPVISAAEADLALARGAALASASAVSLLDDDYPLPEKPHASQTAKLASVLAAAVVAFVVSLSVALGMTLVPKDGAPRIARSEASVPESVPDTPASPAEAAPRAPKPPPPRESEAPATAEPVAVEVVPDAAFIIEEPAGAPPLPEYLDAGSPDYVAPMPDYVAPAPAYIPPAPAYIPPAPPPNYLPPAAAPANVAPVQPPPAQLPAAAVQQQQPRLRDRIIERIPIINRFHEPDPYGQ